MKSTRAMAGSGGEPGSGDHRFRAHELTRSPGAGGAGSDGERAPRASYRREFIQEDAGPFDLVEWEEGPAAAREPVRIGQGGNRRDLRHEAFKLGSGRRHIGLAEEITHEFRGVVP